MALRVRGSRWMPQGIYIPIANLYTTISTGFAQTLFHYRCDKTSSCDANGLLGVSFAKPLPTAYAYFASKNSMDFVQVIEPNINCVQNCSPISALSFSGNCIASDWQRVSFVLNDSFNLREDHNFWFMMEPIDMRSTKWLIRRCKVKVTCTWCSTSDNQITIFNMQQFC